MKNKKYHTVRIILKTIETEAKSIPLTYDSLRSWRGTGTWIKDGRVNLVLWAKPTCLMKKTDFKILAGLLKLCLWGRSRTFSLIPGRNLFTWFGKSWTLFVLDDSWIYCHNFISRILKYFALFRLQSVQR